MKIFSSILRGVVLTIGVKRQSDCGQEVVTENRRSWGP